MMNNKKILILGNANSPFVIHFAKWLLRKRPDFKIDILNTSDIIPNKDSGLTINQIFPKNHFKNPTKLTGLKSLYYFRKKIASIENKEYDIIILHYINPWYAVFGKLLKSKTKKLIPVFWGSDLNRISKNKKNRLKKLFKYSNQIILGSPFLLKKISNELPEFKEQYNMCYFGSEPIESIKRFIDNNNINFKSYFGISDDKISIALGYNGGRAQQHILMIENIKKSKNLLEYKDRIHFVFSLTYGLTSDYKKEIISKLNNFPYTYTILTEFMDETKTAKLRLSTDIFVNLQVTDSFNGTLRESFYANNIIINGKWLPYKILKDYGLYFIEIADINELDKKIIYCISNYEDEKNRHKKNKKIIYNIASWDKTIDSWLKIIEK